MEVFAQGLDFDIGAVLAAILAALGGWQGVRVILKRASALVEMAGQMEAKSKSFDEICRRADSHSVRLAELEKGAMAITALDAKLARHDAHLAAMMEASDNGVWISDNNGMAIACNEALTVMMMCSRDSILGSSWRDSIHPDDREAVVTRWNDFVRGDRSLFSASYRYISADGKQTVAVHGTAIRPVINGVRSDRIYGWAKPITPKEQMP